MRKSASTKTAAFKRINGSVTAPKGFLAGAVYADIKRVDTGKGSAKGKKRDMAVIVSEAPASAAGVFTTNRVCAAPVKVSAKHVASGQAQAIVVNSGNANACTGRRGYRDAETTTKLAAVELGISHKSILVASTGRIGVQLPMQNIKNGLRAAIHLLSSSRAAGAQAAEAIMTTDTHPKEAAVELQLGGKRVRIGGICKGAGMIHPGMAADRSKGPLHATMLCFVTTDAALSPAALRAALPEGVDQSFNRITVDGDMSTNDTVIVLANGMAGNKVITSKTSPDFVKFQAALNDVLLRLAQMIVRDGEGVSRFITLRLSGAKTAEDADRALRAVGNSPLVKTSWNGGDPNWGRIICALGYSQAFLREELVDIGYSLPGASDILWVMRKGTPSSQPLSVFERITKKMREFDIHIRLNVGRASSVLYASDLTEEYVDFNKGE